MNRAFTQREKLLLVLLTVMVIAIGYFKLILEPINNNIENYQTMAANEQDQVLINQTLIQQKKQMEKELEALFENGDPTPIPVYDNSVPLLRELHQILDATPDYSLNFSGTSAMDVSYLIRRPVSMTFRTQTYAQARQILNKLHNSDNVNAISDLSIQNSARGELNEIIFWDQMDVDSDEYPISVSLTITYYERLAK